MDTRQQEKLKEMASQEAMCVQGTTRSAFPGMDEAASPSLRERIANQRRRADTEARHANQLQELEYLLDKNPEVARILDLLDATKLT